MDNYATFSQFYDEIMGERIYDSEKILRFIKEANIKGKELLDVACGTGSTLKYFFDKGFNVTGIDISENMLSFAKKKIPSADLRKMGMTEFEINKSFDTITCLYDSVNHLLSFDEWENFFDKSFKHLKDGGILIFDINTLPKLEKLSLSHSSEKIVENKTIVMKVTSLPNNIFNWNMQILIRNTDNSIEKYEENIKETSFEIQKIKSSLFKNFRDIKVVDSDGLEPNNNSKRVYFVCKK